MTERHNPAAFPVAWTDAAHGNEGMTLRDWFAGKMAAALAANANYDYTSSAQIASDAYEAADAMLAERSKP